MIGATEDQTVAVMFEKSRINNLLVPFAVLVVEPDNMHVTYEVDESRQYGLIYHASAHGFKTLAVDRSYWCEDEKFVSREKGARRIKMPKRFISDGMDFLGYLQNHGINSDSVWCEECRDCYPEDDTCFHIWWCGEVGVFSTPDKRFKCNCEDCRRGRSDMKDTRKRFLTRSKGRSYE